MDIRELETDGRIYVPYNAELREAVENAMQEWIAFCALPEEKKLNFPYAADTNVSGNGYELKKDIATADLKEDFHLRVSARDWLTENARSVDDSITPSFVEKALKLNALMAPIVREFAESVERECEIEGFASDVMSKQDSWLIRFLHYFGGRKQGEEIASPHVDKGGFTLHLYESAPGVERLTYDKRWVDMPLSHDETVIISGMRLQNRSKGALRATCHRVVATEETAKVGRYSAVCFLGFDKGRFYDKVSHGRLQEFAPGAFYDMPFEEFDKLFTD